MTFGERIPSQLPSDYNRFLSQTLRLLNGGQMHTLVGKVLLLNDYLLDIRISYVRADDVFNTRFNASFSVLGNLVCSI